VNFICLKVSNVTGYESRVITRTRIEMNILSRPVQISMSQSVCMHYSVHAVKVINEKSQS